MVKNGVRRCSVEMPLLFAVAYHIVSTALRAGLVDRGTGIFEANLGVNGLTSQVDASQVTFVDDLIAMAVFER